MSKKKDIVIVSKEEAFWTKVKEFNEEKVKETEESLKLLKAVVEMAKAKIEEAKEEEKK